MNQIDRMRKGKASEMIIAGMLIENGLDVFLPIRDRG